MQKYIDIEILDSPEIIDLMIQREVKLNGLGNLDGFSLKKIGRAIKKQVKRTGKQLKKIGKSVVKTTLDIGTLGAYHYQKKVTSTKKLIKRLQAKLAALKKNPALGRLAYYEKNPGMKTGGLHREWYADAMRKSKPILAQIKNIEGQIAQQTKRLKTYRKKRSNIVNTAAVVGTAIVAGPAVAKAVNAAGGAGALLKKGLSLGGQAAKSEVAKTLVKTGVKVAAAKHLSEAMAKYPPAPELNSAEAMIADSLQKQENAKDTSAELVNTAKTVLPWVATAALATMGIMA